MEKQHVNAIVVNQPGQHPVMSIGGGSRNSKNKPVGSNGKRDWSVGLCGCGDEGGCGTCFLAWCCPSIVYGKNKRRFAALQGGRRPDPDIGCCNGACWQHCCISWCGWGWVLQAATRSDVRAHYRINGGCCGDCCAAFWCTPCQLTQEHIELTLEEQSMGGRYY